MFVDPFSYERAGSLEEACELVRSNDGAKIIAGGQSLLPMMNLGLLDVEVVVDVSRLAELAGVAEVDGRLRIGAVTRHADLERAPAVARDQPLLSAAVRHVGNARVRNVGTLGGSLAHADPAAELPLVMTVVGAEYEVSNGRTTRTVAAAEFPVTFFTTQLADDELLSCVRVPKLARGWGWGFEEVSRRAGDFAIVAAASIAKCAGDVIEEARVALAGVADRPVRLASIEASIAGARVDELADAVGEIESIDPVTDTIASAGYRRRLARVLAARALAAACRRSREAT